MMSPSTKQIAKQLDGNALKRRKARRQRALLLTILLVSALSSCVRVPLKDFTPPPERPAWIDKHYPADAQYEVLSKETLREKYSHKIERIKLSSEFGETTLDYYKTRWEQEELILVFPVLGGRKNFIASHFASRLASEGYDAAIVHRDGSFKKPENIDSLEKIFRKNVIRDRIALTFFEREYGKTRFGSFGISRGGINAALTAGIDPRLEINVIVMGGTNLAELFTESEERRLIKFRHKVEEMKGFDKAELRDYLDQLIQTEPKNFAKYVDSKDTLMILALLDTSVPLKYGRKLRAQMRKPETLFILAGHRTIGAYTQLIPIFPPARSIAILPIDYIETEALAFYDHRFKRCKFRLKHFVFELLQFPIAVFERFTRIF